MEYVEGETLAQRVFKSGPVAEGRLAAIAAQMAHGLAEAHRQGVLHRDLKPDNVLLLNAYGHTDFVKIIDFGVAKMMRSPGPTRPLTATDEIIGTAEYMAPEQAACRRSLTGAADVYSLGLTVWFALAAEDPFGGVNRMESMMARFRQSSPPLPANRSASPAMRDLLNNLMAMEPEDRPQAEQAALAFEALRDGAG
jgi:serine/threonine-protein kinase